MPTTPTPFSLHSKDNLELDTSHVQVDTTSTPKVDRLNKRYKSNLQTLDGTKQSCKRLYDSISAELKKNKEKYVSDQAEDSNAVLTQIHPTNLENLIEAKAEFNEERKRCQKNIRALITLCEDEDEDEEQRTEERCKQRLKHICSIAADLNSKLEAIINEIFSQQQQNVQRQQQPAVTQAEGNSDIRNRTPAALKPYNTRLEAFKPTKLLGDVNQKIFDKFKQKFLNWIKPGDGMEVPTPLDEYQLLTGQMDTDLQGHLRHILVATNTTEANLALIDKFISDRNPVMVRRLDFINFTGGEGMNCSELVHKIVELAKLAAVSDMTFEQLY